MPEVKRKRGTFNIRNKTALQSNILKGISGKRALNPTQKSSKARKQQNIRSQNKPELTNDNLLRQKLFLGDDVDFSPFVEAKGATGILKKSEVGTGITSFAKKLNNMVGFESAKTKKSDSGIPKQLILDQGYQKAVYNVNPKNLRLTGGKWDLDIPENFKKVSDKKFVAPKKSYRKSYSYEREGRDRDKDKSYSNYNPAEVLLGSNNKLSRVVERGILTDRYEKEEDSDKEERFQSKSPFVTKKQEYYDSGLLKEQQEFGSIESYEFEEREETASGDRERKIEEDTSYKRSQYNFTPKGFLKESREYRPVDVMEREYQDVDSDRFTEVEEKRKEAQIKRSRNYDPKSGFLTRARDYDIVDASEELQYDDDTSERIVREQSMLRRERNPANPRDFLGRVRSGGTPQPSMAKDFFTVSQTEVDDRGSTEGFKTTRTTTPGMITYYNPLTGDIIDSERLL